MGLSFIGLGLHDLTDITLRGLEVVRQADVVYLEHYTAVISTNKEELEQFFGKKVQCATREMVEANGDVIIGQARGKKVAFLVVGDPFGATTHVDLLLRAKKAGVGVEVVHNASIMSAVGIVGLELYKYGKTTSIVFPEWLPKTPYEVIKMNQANGLHTLCLLDIKVAESSKEDLLKGVHCPQPPRFMTVHEAIDVLRKLESEHKEDVITEDMVMVGVARLGNCGKAVIKAGNYKKLLATDFGKPMHSLIIPGKLHHMEEKMLDLWK